MPSEDWSSRWKEGRVGWHEPAGSASLRRWWPALPPGARVLVPLCGKSFDLAWLAEQGQDVTGVELSEIAVQAFFREQGFSARVERRAGFDVYRADEARIALWCGDFFDFPETGFDAHYDRGALVALPADLRPGYVAHLWRCLGPAAARLVLTLEYDQERAAGPPFSVPAAEVMDYFPDLERVSVHNDAASAPPKIRDAGIESFVETVWRSPGAFRR